MKKPKVFIHSSCSVSVSLSYPTQQTQTQEAYSTEGERERAMASLAQQFTGLRCPPLSSSRLSKPLFTSKQTHKGTVQPLIVSAAVAISNAQTKDRAKLKQLFEEAYERCRTAPTEGVAFTLETFHTALEKYDFNSELGTKVGWPLFLGPCVFPCFFEIVDGKWV